MRLTTNSVKETQKLGAAIGKNIRPRDLILLVGELGAGKTALTQGIAKGVGVTDSVRSPTFVLATEYTGRLMLYHIDLYRLDNILDIENMGLEEYIESEGACVVEWADKAIPIFPKSHLMIELKNIGKEKRDIVLTAYGNRHTTLISDIRESLAKRI